MKKNIKTETRFMNMDNPKMTIYKQKSIETPAVQDDVSGEVLMELPGFAPYGSFVHHGTEKTTADSNQQTKTQKQDEDEDDNKDIVLDMDFKRVKDPNNHKGARKHSTIQMIEESFKLRNQIRSPVPSLPKKQLFMSFCLLILGIVLLVVGTSLAVGNESASSGIAFWVIGAICGLPGLFYAIKFFQVCYARSGENKRRALEEIPQE
jgi:hypothetical protein